MSGYKNKGKLTTASKNSFSKHTATFIKQELLNELDLEAPKIKNDIWSLKHCVVLIEKRNDRLRVEELVDLFLISNNNRKFDSVKNFYWWYKDNHITSTDSKCYLIFDDISEEMGLSQCNPTKFSGHCEWLVERLVKWKGAAGNDIDDLLIDYFSAVLSKSLKINKSFATTPKSLLNDFGWDLWLEYIEKQFSSKLQYLDAAPELLKNSKKESSKLLEIQYVKDKALKEGNIKLYDEIGNLLTNKTIKETYEEIHRCS